jgi:NAD-dependent dihydropyrimidine dehydrogenase PreA subunit
MLTDTPPVGEPLLQNVSAEELLALAEACGADDAGLVSINDPAIAEDLPHIRRAFPATRTLLALVARIHREPVRSPTRSVANLEFHSASNELDDIARLIVRRLEDRGVRALNPAVAFPMEMEHFPERGWIVSHKRVAEAAGLGKMGVHRSLIHPKFGSFVLLATVLIGEDVGAKGKPLDFNPCFECKLCVAACPVGALKPNGYFDFSTCLTHNYQQFLGGFVNFVEDIAGSRSVKDFRAKQSYAETVTRWQSLSYGPNYNAAYCIWGGVACDAKIHLAIRSGGAMDRRTQGARLLRLCQ